MSDNFSTASADAALTAFAGVALWVQLHTGDPGTSGTANVSSVTTRQQVTWGTASGGVLSATNSPVWTNWAGTNGESVSDVSYWNQASAGTFEGSSQITSDGEPAPVTMDTTDTLTLSPLSVTFPTAS
jgi:hypothetical protein